MRVLAMRIDALRPMVETVSIAQTRLARSFATAIDGFGVLDGVIKTLKR
jgi:hypothetical protein